jgi:mono/diheme cytochrome c family protein
MLGYGAVSGSNGGFGVMRVRGVAGSILQGASMSYFHVKSWIALLVMGAGVTALASMLALMGRSDRRLRAERLRGIHRASGYAFAALIVVAAIMGLRYLGAVGDALPLRGVIHWVVAALLVVVLGLKIVVVRLARQFLKFVPVLGLIVFSLVFVVVVVSAVFFLVTGGAVGGLSAPASAGSRAARVERGTAIAAGDASRGEILFELHCSFCHHPDSGEAKVGPGLANLMAPGRLLSSGAAATPESVLAQLVDPMGSMPSFAETLSEAELNDVMAYLARL